MRGVGELGSDFADRTGRVSALGSTAVNLTKKLPTRLWVTMKGRGFSRDRGFDILTALKCSGTVIPTARVFGARDTSASSARPSAGVPSCGGPASGTEQVPGAASGRRRFGRACCGVESGACRRLPLRDSKSALG